jgi:hypothetical protein
MGEIEIGRITSVMFENNRIHVNVKTTPSYEHREIEFTTPATGMWSVPTEGDIVEVYEVTTETYAARTPHIPAKPEMPDLKQGDLCFALNEETRLWFSTQEDGTVKVDLQADGDISISTATGGNVSVESDGDVTVNGDSITLGNDGGAESLAVQSHNHSFSYSWSDTAGSGSGNTSGPNQSGTSKTKAE